jgi:hypothetical protein
MNRIVRFLSVTASVGAAAMVLSLTSAGPALAQTFKPVMSLIVNDAAHPVPVVDVGKTPVPAIEPFQHWLSSFDESSLSLVVPADKRLVIEFYSGASRTHVPCTMAAMTVGTNLSSGSMPHSLLAVPVPEGEPTEFTHYTTSQLVHFYAAPGTSVVFRAVTNPRGCPADFDGVVSGYLIDVP